MTDPNALGVRGEAIFNATMTKFHEDGPLFRVHFLGDEWPLVDFICELEGSWKQQRPFFFVQVKATKLGYTNRDGRLKVTIAHRRVVEVTKYKAPVYLVGVDTDAERAFVVAMCGRRIQGLNSLDCSTELDVNGRLRLWRDVRRYWTGVTRQRSWTTLWEPRWK